MIKTALAYCNVVYSWNKDSASQHAVNGRLRKFHKIRKAENDIPFFITKQRGVFRQFRRSKVDFRNLIPFFKELVDDKAEWWLLLYNIQNFNGKLLMVRQAYSWWVMEPRVSSHDILSQTLISIEHCVYLSKILVWKAVYNDTEIICQSVSNVAFINVRIFTNTEYHKQTSFLYCTPTPFF